MFDLPDLPYAYDALEPYIDEPTMRLHHTKHHASYVDNLNKTLEKYPDLLQKDIEKLLVEEIPQEVKQAVANHGGGHFNHSFFWKSMCPPSEYKEPSDDSPFLKKLYDDLGSWSGFQEYFREEAMSRFGSGWVWLVIGDDGMLDVVSTPNQDNPITEGRKPILGLDVWEHAYYLKYQNRRAEYIEAWWNVVNWDFVQERFLNA